MKIKKKNYIKFLFFISVLLLFQTKSFSLENKIILKVNNEIITTLDLENEINYLTALNPNIKKLNDNEIIQLSKRSILNEKIKKIEILKNFQNASLPEKFLEELLKNIYNNYSYTHLVTYLVH